MLMSTLQPLAALENASEFHARHIGPYASDEVAMLSVIGAASRRALIEAIVPASIKRSVGMDLPPVAGEAAALAELKAVAAQNKVLKSYIGQGYYDTLTPGVILRNILENPAWYTAYTPYQAEISQGRMEALVNFQTMVTDLTGMAIANASMLDEATAAAEAMTLAARVGKSKSQVFFVADDVLPQTLEVIRTRAEPLGFTVQVGPAAEAGKSECFAALLQYPGVFGEVRSLQAAADALHAQGALLIAAADLLALTLIKAPAEMGADIAIGTTQRFGMPMCNGGPHAAYMACKDEYKRNLPGRLVGVSIDAHGNQAYRLALQTREQHIRREKATSNICTAQVLLGRGDRSRCTRSITARKGLLRIAQRRRIGFTVILAVQELCKARAWIQDRPIAVVLRHADQSRCRRHARDGDAVEHARRCRSINSAPVAAVDSSSASALDETTTDATV